MLNFIKTNLSVHKNQNIRTQAHPGERKVQWQRHQPPKMEILAQFLVQFLPFLPSGDAKIQKTHLNSCLTSSKQTYLPIKIKILEHRHIQGKGRCSGKGISPQKWRFWPNFWSNFCHFALCMCKNTEKPS